MSDENKPPIEDFFTRERANEGIKVPLFKPDGEISPHWVIVRGVDSDEFQRAKAKQMRRVGQLTALPDDEKEEAVRDATLDMVTALVAGWSFDLEFTSANVRNFLYQAPQIAEKVDEFASRRSVFFRKPSSD